MDCIFCKIADKKIKTEFVYADDRVIAFKDINPVSPEHMLIVPKQHIDKISGLTTKDDSLISHLIHVANTIARKKHLDKKGYRLIFNCGEDGGQIINHMHLHLIGGRKLNWPPG